MLIDPFLAAQVAAYAFAAIGVFSTYRAVYLAGMRKGMHNNKKPRAQKPKTRRAEPTPLHTFAEIATALQKELNKGKNADPVEVARLAKLNNDYRRKAA